MRIAMAIMALAPLLTITLVSQPIGPTVYPLDGTYTNVDVTYVVSADQVPTMPHQEVTDGVGIAVDGTRFYFVERVLRFGIHPQLQLEYADTSCGRPCAILYTSFSVKSLASSTDPMNVRADLQDGILEGKLWPVGAPEPTNWTVSAAVSKLPLPGGLELIATQSHVATSTTHTFDDVVVTGT